MNWSVLGRSKGKLRTMHLHYPPPIALARPCIAANLGRIFRSGRIFPPTPRYTAKEVSHLRKSPFLGLFAARAVIVGSD